MGQCVVSRCQWHRLAVCMLAGWGDRMGGELPKEKNKKKQKENIHHQRNLDQIHLVPLIFKNALNEITRIPFLQAVRLCDTPKILLQAAAKPGLGGSRMLGALEKTPPPPLFAVD